jgi:hypothetical protein
MRGKRISGDRLSELVRVVKYLRGWSCSVDALPYLGPRLPVVAAGDLMVDRSFRWSDCGRSVFRGPPRWACVPRSLLELAARVGRIGDGLQGTEVRERRCRTEGRDHPAGFHGT